MVHRGRPDFIPAENFREWMPATRTSEYLRVGGVQGAGFIARCARDGRPVRSRTFSGNVRYRLLDIVARGRADLLDIEPPIDASLKEMCAELAEGVLGLKALRDKLRKESAKLEAEIEALLYMKKLRKCSIGLTGETLLREDEIVSVAQDVPELSGVYFLILGQRIVYIGQSTNVFSRVKQHKDKNFDRFTYIPCDPGNLDVMESLYIHYLRPPLNGTRPDGRTPLAPLRLDTLLRRAA